MPEKEGQPPSQDVAYLPGQESAVEAPFRTLNHHPSFYLLLTPYSSLLCRDQLGFNPAADGRMRGDGGGGVGLEDIVRLSIGAVQGPFSSASVCLGKGRGGVSCIINEGG